MMLAPNVLNALRNPLPIHTKDHEPHYNPFNRVYTTEEFWRTPMGSVSTDRELTARFAQERTHKSTIALFHVLSSLAIGNSQSVNQYPGVRVCPPGYRKYSQRGLAAAANMAVNTIRQGLRELSAMGLIEVNISSHGTLVGVLRFERIAKKSLCRVSYFKNEERVSNSPTYRISPILDLYKLTSIVDVGMKNKEEDPPKPKKQGLIPFEIDVETGEVKFLP